jgi:DNA-binding beta-propeller fold protein YncE/uncharacterized membrane protein
MHTARIRCVAVDGSGKRLATASEDQTVRLWDVDTGELVATLRPPSASGKGVEGGLYACAFSPDGKVLATGGYTRGPNGTFSVFLFEVASGRILGRIPGLPHAVDRLVYAQDGRLAVCMSYDGIRVYRPDGREAFRDSYMDQSRGADFDRAGRLVTSSWDGNLHLYNAEGGLEAKVQTGGRPLAVRFSPDGSRVAVGYRDSARVELRSGADLALKGTADTSKARAFKGVIAWSADGKTLYTALGHPKDDQVFVRAWSHGGDRGWSDFPVSREFVEDLASLPDGRIAWVSNTPAWGLLGGLARAGCTLEFRDQSLDLDPEGTRICFGYTLGGRRPAVFDAAARELRAGRSPELQGPRTSAAGGAVTGLKSTQPQWNGLPLILAKYEYAESCAILPQGGFLLGADWNLYAFGPQGQKLWRVPSPGAAWAVNVNQDGTLGVAAYGDGTIRWYRISDGKELLAFLPHADQKRWVLWTPSGYYDCSPGAEDLIGWHLDRGQDEAADFFPVSQFRATYYRPDIIARILQTRDEAKALGLANEARSRQMADEAKAMQRAAEAKAKQAADEAKALQRVNGAKAKELADEAKARQLDEEARARRLAEEAMALQVAGAASIEQLLPPVVAIESPTRGQTFTAQTLSVTVRVHHPKDKPIDEVWATVDGRALSTRGVQIKGTLTGTEAGRMVTLEVPVPARDCVVSVLARSGQAVSPAASVSLKWAGATKLEAKGVLRVLAVGVSRYRNAELNLDFAAKDARDLAGRMAAQQDRLYGAVQNRVLLDADATREAILDGLKWLAKATTERDTAVIFLAGHGLNDARDQFFFLPHGADLARIEDTTVAGAEIQAFLAAIPGRVVVFLDSCHSGAVMKRNSSVTRFVNELGSAENGVVVFTASTGTQLSLESSEWNNGAFTKALDEGLDGQADLFKKGRVTVSSLDAFLGDRVPALTNGQQTPTVIKPAAVPDFPVALTK